MSTAARASRSTDDRAAASARRVTEHLRLLAQDRVWTSADWRSHRVAWMSPSHRRGVLEHLERHRFLLYATEHQMIALHHEDPILTEQEWFETRPLIVRLRALTT